MGHILDQLGLTSLILNWWPQQAKVMGKGRIGLVRFSLAIFWFACPNISLTEPKKVSFLELSKTCHGTTTYIHLQTEWSVDKGDFSFSLWWKKSCSAVQSFLLNCSCGGLVANVLASYSDHLSLKPYEF